MKWQRASSLSWSKVGWGSWGKLLGIPAVLSSNRPSHVKVCSRLQQHHSVREPLSIPKSSRLQVCDCMVGCYNYLDSVSGGSEGVMTSLSQHVWKNCECSTGQQPYWSMGNGMNVKQVLLETHEVQSAFCWLVKVITLTEGRTRWDVWPWVWMNDGSADPALQHR